MAEISGIIGALAAGITALVTAGVSFGVMRARINNHNRELKRLDACKMEKDVANSQFNAINEKLDLLLKYFSKGEK